MLAIAVIGAGTVAGLMHKTGFMWNVGIYKIIPVLTAIAIIMALMRESRPKLAVKYKDSSLTGMWLSLMFLSLLAIAISGTTAFLSGWVAAFANLHPGLIFWGLFVSVLLLWIGWSGVVIAVAGEFWKAFFWGSKTDDEIWWECMSRKPS